MKKVIAVLILAVIFLNGCSFRYDNDDYADYLDREYCDKNYECVDYNLVHLECTLKKVYGYYIFLEYGYRAIPDISHDDMLVSYHLKVDTPSYEYTCIVTPKDDPVDPINDYKINTVELFWKTESFDIDDFSLKKICNYDKFSRGSQLASTEDEEIISMVKEVILEETPISRPKESYNDDSVIFNGDRFLNLRLRFEESEYIAWDARVYTFDDQYYLVIRYGVDHIDSDNGEGNWIMISKEKYEKLHEFIQNALLEDESETTTDD